MEKNICGIYIIENKTSGKKYIGQSKNIIQRFYQHKSRLRGNIHPNKKLQNAWNKYGEDDFIFNILKVCDLKDLDDMEEFYILKFNSFSEGFNQDLGGKKNKFYNPIAHPKDNFTISQKLHDAHQNECHNILQINFNGEIVNKWDSARWASKQLNIQQSVIWNCLKKQRKKYRGFVWIYEEDYNENFDITQYVEQNTQAKEICKYSIDGRFIKTYPSANSTIDDGFDCSSVIKCCKHKISKHKGYIFRYKNDDNILKEQNILISRYDLEGNHIDDFISLKEAYDKTGIDKSMISKCCNLKPKSKTAGGYIWKYAENLD